MKLNKATLDITFVTKSLDFYTINFKFFVQPTT